MHINNQRKIACIGSGTIGSSWALNFATKGHLVSVQDVSDEQLKKSRNTISDGLNFLSQRGLLQSSAGEILSNITFTTSIKEAVEDSFLIQESGPETYEIKKKILKEIDEHAPKEAIYASSTSGLLITGIAEDSELPQRCIGAHPYNPPHLIPLVEITKGKKTDSEVARKAYLFYKELGKEPVILEKESLGFIGNRLSFALYRELISLVLSGVCTVEDIDKVVTYGIGIRWAILGPVMLYDLGGGDAGIKGMAKLDFTLNQVFKDLSSMDKMPENWYDTATEGLNSERENFPKLVGNTKEEIADFRNEMLIEILKLHNKI